MTPDERLNLISGLREFADFLEAHSELPLESVCELQIMMGYVPPPQTHEPNLRLWAKAFGTFQKTVSDYYFRVTRAFGGLRVAIAVDRDRVCRKVRKKVEVETWECPASLLEGNSDMPADEIPAEV